VMSSLIISVIIERVDRAGVPAMYL
jgi:hypothetical protein